MLENELHNLGAKLRHARRARKLRLKDVAREVGCSESLLSKIECGKATPSLRMLHRIVGAFDTSIASLFPEQMYDEVRIYRGGQRPAMVINSGSDAPTIALERVIPYSDGRLLEANIHVIEAGASNGGEIKHAGEEMGYVLEGQVELRVADGVYDLEQGDSFFFRSELPHSYQNKGRSVARVLWINTPPTF